MASDYLLEIEGTKGEGQDMKLKESIEIESFSWGATQPGSFNTGMGGATGKVSFQDFHFSTKANKASPNLMTAITTHKHIGKATLHVRKATGAGGQQVYYKIVLTDCAISSYQSSGNSGGDSIPNDQFSFNFAKILFEYKPQNNKGGLEAAVTSEYDIKTQDAK